MSIEQEAQSNFSEELRDFDTRMITKAIALSEQALDDPENYGPYGAVIVRDSDRKVIAEGLNNMGKTKDPSAHGEIVAIREACKALDQLTLEGCTIYCSCEPCPMCYVLIQTTKIARIVYGCPAMEHLHKTHVHEPLEELEKPIEKRSIPASSLLSSKAADILNRFRSR